MLRDRHIDQIPVDRRRSGKPIGLVDVQDLLAAQDHLMPPAFDLTAIQFLVLDVDGILTDGMLYVAEDGTAMKRFAIIDGAGLVYWQRAGLQGRDHLGPRVRRRRAPLPARSESRRSTSASRTSSRPSST